MGRARNNPLDRFVRGRHDVQINQHADKFEDRRTKRNRDRSTQERHAIEDQDDDE